MENPEFRFLQKQYKENVKYLSNIITPKYDPDYELNSIDGFGNITSFKKHYRDEAEELLMEDLLRSFENATIYFEN